MKFQNNTNYESKLTNIFEQISKEVNFNGNKSAFLNRIRKIGYKTDFTLRDNKLLKKLIDVSVEYGNINLDQIEYFFPGKDPSQIRKEIGRILFHL